METNARSMDIWRGNSLYRIYDAEVRLVNRKRTKRLPKDKQTKSEK